MTAATDRGYSDPKLPFYTNRCMCPTCGEYFNSETAFDKHRRGKYPNRVCMNERQMRLKGMAKNKAGYWITEILPDKRCAPCNSDSSQDSDTKTAGE